MGFRIGPGPACCCDPGVCCIFEDPLAGPELDPRWTNSGALTLVSGGADLAEDETVSTTVSLADPNGIATIFCLPEAGESLEFKFAVADANNYWLCIAYIDTFPGTFPAGNTAFAELYEVVGGVSTHKGTRFWPTTGPSLQISACWYESGRVRVVIGTDTDLLFEWPNNVTGGVRFEATARGGDVKIWEATLCKHYLDQADCYCVGMGDCMQCVDELSDTWQVEILSGPSTGEIYILDRYLDWPFYPPAWSLTNNNAVSYWVWYSERTDLFDPFYKFNIQLCKTGFADDVGRFTVELNADGGTEGTQSFTLTDCVGPFDVTVGGTSYRLTPL